MENESVLLRKFVEKIRQKRNGVVRACWRRITALALRVKVKASWMAGWASPNNFLQQKPLLKTLIMIILTTWHSCYFLSETMPFHQK